MYGCGACSARAGYYQSTDLQFAIPGPHRLLANPLPWRKVPCAGPCPCHFTRWSSSRCCCPSWEAPVADVTSDDLVESCTASLEPGAWVMNGQPLDVGDGYAVWDGLEPGTVNVSNGAAGDKDDTASAVYCSIAPGDGVPIVGIEVPVKGGAIEVVFDQPAIVYCAWFVGP